MWQLGFTGQEFIQYMNGNGVGQGGQFPEPERQIFHDQATQGLNPSPIIMIAPPSQQFYRGGPLWRVANKIVEMGPGES